MTTRRLLALLDDLIGQVRRSRSAFEPGHVTAERVWGLRRAPFGGVALESFAFVGYLGIRRGQAPVGYPVAADLRAAVLANDWPMVLGEDARPTLALLGFMTMAAERLNAEDTASRPAD